MKIKDVSHSIPTEYAEKIYNKGRTVLWVTPTLERYPMGPNHTRLGGYCIHPEDRPCSDHKKVQKSAHNNS